MTPITSTPIPPQLEHYERLLEPIWAWSQTRHLSGSSPARILEDASQIVLECDVAGCAPGDIDVVLSGRVLAIAAGKGPRVEQSFSVPVAVDLTQMRAELSGGRLRVTLPRRKHGRA